MTDCSTPNWLRLLGELADQPPRHLVLLASDDPSIAAIVGRAVGAASLRVVELGLGDDDDVSGLPAVVEQLERAGLSAPPGVGRANTTDEVFARCRAERVLDGWLGLSVLPEGTADRVAAHDVLTRVRTHQLPDWFNEIRRVLRAGGTSRHLLTLEDAGGGLRDLFVPEAVWESPLTPNVVYRNRLTADQLAATARRAGFRAQLGEIGRWPSLPVPPRRLAWPFRNLSEAELLVRSATLDLS